MKLTVTVTLPFGEINTPSLMVPAWKLVQASCNAALAIVGGQPELPVALRKRLPRPIAARTGRVLATLDFPDQIDVSHIHRTLGLLCTEDGLNVVPDGTVLRALREVANRCGKFALELASDYERTMLENLQPYGEAKRDEPLDGVVTFRPNAWWARDMAVQGHATDGRRAKVYMHHCPHLYYELAREQPVFVRVDGSGFQNRRSIRIVSPRSAVPIDDDGIGNISLLG